MKQGDCLIHAQRILYSTLFRVRWDPVNAYPGAGETLGLQWACTPPVWQWRGMTLCNEP
jgi:hypothetical protein